MKIDRKARVLLLYVLLPAYLACLVVFVYISSAYMGRYELPRQRLDEAFAEFAAAGYTLAQDVTVPGPQGPVKVPAGTPVTQGLAEGLVKAYGVLGRQIAVVEPGARFEPKAVPAGEAAAHAAAGVFLVRPVSIGAPPEGIQLEAGTELTLETAGRIESAAGSVDTAPEITIAAAAAAKVPASVESGEFTAFVAAEYILDDPVNVTSDGEEAIKEKGTILNRDLVLALMRMRDDKTGKATVKVRGKGPVIGFQWTFLFVVFNFAVLVVFLYGLLWKPVLGVLDRRREAIGSDIEQAKDSREKAEELFQKYRQTMEAARGEREQIIEDGRREGDEQRQRIVAEAKAESAAILERAAHAVEAQQVELKKELTGQVAGFSAELAGKILAREVRREDHSALVEEFIGRIGSSEGKEG